MTNDKNFINQDKIDYASTDIEAAIGLAQSLQDELEDALGRIIHAKNVQDFEDGSDLLTAYAIFARRHAITALSDSLLRELRSAHDTLNRGDANHDE